MDHTVYQSTITPLSSIINDVTDTFYINLRKMIGPARLAPRGASADPAWGTGLRTHGQLRRLAAVQSSPPEPGL